MDSTPTDALLERLLAEQLERPLPPLVRREVAIPDIPGTAAALIGMRRCGKTYRLFDEMERLHAGGLPRDRMLYLNLEDDRLGTVGVGTLDRAVELFFRRSPAARTEGGAILLDEIQVVPGWERFARRLLDTEAVRLLVTGSSARMLSTEIASAFRGRSLTVEVLPFSPREAAVAEGVAFPSRWPPSAAVRSRLDAFLLDYLEVGGFPAARSLYPHDRIQQLQEYVDLVVLRDVAERHRASNLQALRALVSALFAANAGGFSVSRLHGALVSQGLKVGKATLLTYLDHLVDAFLVFLLPLRSRSARQRTVNPRKVYAVDTGLARAMHRAGARDRGALLENAVYLELRRRYGRLADTTLTWVKTRSGREVDFAVDDPIVGGPPQLIQVCWSMSDPATRGRELDALVEAMGETGCTLGTVVTLADEDTLDTPAGRVRVIPARECFFGPDAGPRGRGGAGR